MQSELCKRIGNAGNELNSTPANGLLLGLDLLINVR